jgi:hypothetical protein
MTIETRIRSLNFFASLWPCAKSGSSDAIFLWCSDESKEGVPLPHTFADGTIIRTDGQWVRLDGLFGQDFFRVGQTISHHGRRVTVGTHAHRMHQKIYLLSAVAAVLILIVFFGMLTTIASTRGLKVMGEHKGSQSQGEPSKNQKGFSPTPLQNFNVSRANGTAPLQSAEPNPRGENDSEAKKHIPLNPFRCSKIAGVSSSSTDDSRASNRKTRSTEETWYVCR